MARLRSAACSVAPKSRLSAWGARPSRYARFPKAADSIPDTRSRRPHYLGSYQPAQLIRLVLLADHVKAFYRSRDSLITKRPLECIDLVRRQVLLPRQDVGEVRSGHSDEPGSLLLGHALNPPVIPRPAHCEACSALLVIPERSQDVLTDRLWSLQ